MWTTPNRPSTKPHILNTTPQNLHLKQHKDPGKQKQTKNARATRLPTRLEQPLRTREAGAPRSRVEWEDRGVEWEDRGVEWEDRGVEWENLKKLKGTLNFPSWQVASLCGLSPPIWDE